MRVLLPAVDIFYSVGGGQSFYKQLIKANPDIEFSYLIRNESDNEIRPSNCKAIKYDYKFPNLHVLNPSFDFSSVPTWARHAVSNAANIAYSARGLNFDIIDIPDWEQHGCFLRFFLNHFNVKFNKIALSMHGNISTTLYTNWDTSHHDYSSLEFLEKAEYLGADIRYAISEFYIEEWEKRSNLRADYLHPFTFFKPEKPKPYIKTSEVPSLLFFGRTEKRKGPDFLTHLTWMLPKNLFINAFIIGPSVPLENKTTSKEVLNTLIKNRNLNIEVKDSVSQATMQEFFTQSNLTVLPSRYDTFNLVALESLFAGCPVVVGENTGVVSFIKKEFPAMPIHVLPMDDLATCIKVLEHAIENYHEDRKTIAKVLESFDNRTFSSKSLLEIYKQPSKRIRETDFPFDEIAKSFLQICSENSLSQNNELVTPNPLSLKQKTIEKIKHLGKHRNYKNESGFQKTISSIAGFLPRLARKYRLKKPRLFWLNQVSLHYKTISTNSECGKTNIATKLKNLNDLVPAVRFGKTHIYEKIAGLQIVLNKPIIAATYYIRSFRLAGKSKLNTLKFATATLEASNYIAEANATKLLYNDDQKQTGIKEYLENQRKKLLPIPKYDEDFLFKDDRRSKQFYKISIIVSLYNAANKLEFFLNNLQRQTMVINGSAEIILVDSGSPTNEREVFLKLIDSLKIEVIYVRTKSRETIQKAWNRGILLAQGEYLTFLGVDEGITPEALKILSAELDADPSTDWIQSNSLMTDVSKNGTWLNDVMIFERSNFHPFHIYLETCYISWVGALYRKSIHDRFGYYDDTFRAAGDTEFKNRMGPFVKMKTLPITLGIFFNYPEERATHSPTAELEDLRAWYLFRTPEGMEYALQGRDQSFVEQSLLFCLKYRKSYCSHWSTDIELAWSVINYIAKHFPTSNLIILKDNIFSLREAFKGYDNEAFTSGENMLAIRREFNKARKNLQDLLKNLGFDKASEFHYSNDNRYEQHHSFWQ
jgi:glycosyltransferase involved in cell wall biosynthesis